MTATLYDQLGIQVADPAFDRIPETVQAPAYCLRTVQLAQEMLVFDIAMLDVVLNAVSKAWTDT